MKSKVIKAVRKPNDVEPGEEGEAALELVCAQHDEAGVRIFMNPDTRDITIVCRDCLCEVARSSGEEDAIVVTSKRGERVH